MKGRSYILNPTNYVEKAFDGITQRNFAKFLLKFCNFQSRSRGYAFTMTKVQPKQGACDDKCTEIKRQIKEICSFLLYLCKCFHNAL